MRNARLCVADKAIWPEVGYLDFDSVIARMQVSIDARRIWLLPKWSERCAVDTNAGHFIDSAQVEPELAAGKKLIGADVNGSSIRRGAGEIANPRIGKFSPRFQRWHIDVRRSAPIRRKVEGPART